MLKNAVTRAGLTITGNTQGIQSNCNSITFENAGTATVTVSYEGITRTLLPFDSFTHGSDKIENIETTVYDIAFTVAGTSSCIVERAYIKENQINQC